MLQDAGISSHRKYSIIYQALFNSQVKVELVHYNTSSMDLTKQGMHFNAPVLKTLFKPKQ